MRTEVYSNGVLVEVIDNRTIQQAKKYGIELVKIAASKAIFDAGLDEKTQLNAIAGIYSTERCEAIKNYIAACRNEYLRCKAMILAATTNDEADSVTFILPTIPEGL